MIVDLKTPDESIVTVTEHAYLRAKERLTWNRRTLDKMAAKAFIEGLVHKDTKGTLNKFVTKVWHSNKACNNIRIYGENVYFFIDNKLITLYRIESKLLRYVKACKKTNEKK